MSQERPHGADALIGATVSRYRILDRLGRGGMGVVYRALDTSLDREVALKFLPPYAASDRESEERFIMEAKAVSALDHPNIAVVHEIDRTPDHGLYMAMAYYRGETLREKIRRGPMDVNEAVGYARQIAEGLQRAHEEGIIHRDIKPENVIVTERGLAKILDFGLAKMQDVNLTVTGTSMGTMAYMSPEQSFGGPVDHRADLWALGVIFYEMLAGRHPFLKAGAAQASVLYASANDPHEPLAAARPDVPEACSGIVDALLRKDPDLRYARAADVVRDLAALQSGETHLSQTVAFETLERPRAKPTVRTPTLLIGGAAVALLLGFVWMFAAGTDADLSGPSPEARSAARVHVDNGLTYFANGQLDLARAEIERALEQDSTYSAAWSTLAAVDIRAQDYEDAITRSRTAIRLDSLNTTGHYNLALALEESGETSEAVDAYRRAIDIDPGFVQAYSALGNLYIELRDTERALEVLQNAAERRSDSELMFLIYKNMGKARLAQGAHASAVELLQRSFSLEPSWPETAALLAEAFAGLGRDDESRSYYERYAELEPDPMKREEVRQRLGLDG